MKPSIEHIAKIMYKHKRFTRAALLVVVYILSLGGVTAIAQTTGSVISPGKPWLDDHGHLIQAHGGGIIRLNSIYYWFGEDRSQTNDVDKRYVSCYSSGDLVHWKFLHQVVAIADPENLGPKWILERPKVFYNAKNRKFVMYAHLDSPGYKLARVAVLTSDKVDGDYQYIRSFRPLDQESRDIGQFVDDDGTAYLIFESRPTGGFFIAKLSDDYMGVEKQVAFIKEPLEGGAIVHYNDLYYFVGSHLTGWRPNPNVYATAASLSGPWSTMRDIAPPESNTYNSQSSMLIKVVGSKSTSIIYVGDRWAPKELWNSRYIWMPLETGNGTLTLPQPRDWTIDISTGVSSILSEPDNIAAQVSGVWSPDVGNGTYKNPVLNADYSDPDAIRVDDKFYLVSSSFDSVPGLPILESYDLVNWRLIGHALPKQPPFDRYSGTQHGNGVWAPALRYHDGEFFLFYPDPDFGIYMIKAKDAAGPWTEPLLIKAAKGWIDPCPLWDEDGSAYLVSALAGSRAGAKSVAIVSRMKPDGTALLDNGVIVYDGHQLDPTFEGPKLYKRHGFYYIFAPAGGVPTGWQVVLRSQNIYGPYERRIVLQQGTTAINGPHQGAWVDTGTGEDWFLHFQDAGWMGRVVHLEPMKWVDDWPQIGDTSHGSIGQPVLTHSKPTTLHASIKQNPADSDDFNAPTLGLQWQWQANPGPTWAFPSQSLGVLRLIAIPSPPEATNLWSTPAVLLQKLPGPNFTVTTKLKPSFANDGDRAGVVLLGKDYASLIVAQTQKGLVVQQIVCMGADQSAREAVSGEAVVTKPDLYLRMTLQNEIAAFSYSEDGVAFKPIGRNFEATPGVWVGAKIGIFSSGNTDHGEFGFADFDWFRFKSPLKE